MSAVFIRIRADIEHPLNVEIMSQMLNALNCNESFDENKVRRYISTVNGLDREIWDFAFHNNLYVNHAILKDNNIYSVLSTSCTVLKNVLKKGNYEQAYELVDCIQSLPEILADNHFTITKSFWKVNIKRYRDKWDKNFLIQEQKAL